MTVTASMTVVAVAFVGVFGVVAARGVRARADRRTAEADVVGLGGHLARSVRGGSTLADALAHAAQLHGGALGAELQAIQARLARGDSLDAALESVLAGDRRAGAPRSGRSRIRPHRAERSSWCALVRACRLGLRSSGDLATVIDGALTSLSDERELLDETAALTAQARVSVYVLAALPLVGATVFALVDPRVGDVLVSTGIGRACLVVGLVLDATGLWCAGRLVDRAVR